MVKPNYSAPVAITNILISITIFFTSLLHVVVVDKGRMNAKDILSIVFTGMNTHM